MECSRRVAYENDAKTTRYDRAMMCNYGVTAPLWERQNADSCQEHASTALSASACKILTNLQDEDTYRKFIVVV